eukprot:GHVS01031940.1.p1 GENE.GHVS01031940.1~~GHVS01031940.1.p1  ORF type:complete len:826 (+),score=80.74 GHVS01031940.1:71-2548(+)
MSANPVALRRSSRERKTNRRFLSGESEENEGLPTKKSTTSVASASQSQGGRIAPKSKPTQSSFHKEQARFSTSRETKESADFRKVGAPLKETGKEHRGAKRVCHVAVDENSIESAAVELCSLSSLIPDEEDLYYNMSTPIHRATTPARLRRMSANTVLHPERDLLDFLTARVDAFDPNLWENPSLVLNSLVADLQQLKYTFVLHEASRLRAGLYVDDYAPKELDDFCRDARRRLMKSALVGGGTVTLDGRYVPIGHPEAISVETIKREEELESAASDMLASKALDNRAEHGRQENYRRPVLSTSKRMSEQKMESENGSELAFGTGDVVPSNEPTTGERGTRAETWIDVTMEKEETCPALFSDDDRRQLPKNEKSPLQKASAAKNEANHTSSRNNGAGGKQHVSKKRSKAEKKAAKKQALAKLAAERTATYEAKDGEISKSQCDSLLGGVVDKQQQQPAPSWDDYIVRPEVDVIPQDTRPEAPVMNARCWREGRVTPSDMAMEQRMERSLLGSPPVVGTSPTASMAIGRDLVRQPRPPSFPPPPLPPSPKHDTASWTEVSRDVRKSFEDRPCISPPIDEVPRHGRIREGFHDGRDREDMRRLDRGSGDNRSRAGYGAEKSIASVLGDSSTRYQGRSPGRGRSSSVGGRREHDERHRWRSRSRERWRTGREGSPGKDRHHFSQKSPSYSSSYAGYERGEQQRRHKWQNADDRSSRRSSPEHDQRESRKVMGPTSPGPTGSATAAGVQASLGAVVREEHLGYRSTDKTVVESPSTVEGPSQHHFGYGASRKNEKEADMTDGRSGIIQEIAEEGSLDEEGVSPMSDISN